MKLLFKKMLLLFPIFFFGLSFGLTTARIRLTDESLDYLPGYSRNYTPANLGWGRRLVKANADEWAPATFCDASQQNQFQNNFWPRLSAFPGANITVDYILSPGDSSERGGYVTLFGSNNAGSPDTRQFQDFFPHDSSIAELARVAYEDVISTRRTTFQIATNVGSSSPFSLYWMWNTTISMSGGWVIYTSCYDIDLMAFPAKSTSKLGTTTETATASNSATLSQAAVSPKSSSRSSRALSRSSSISRSKSTDSESLTTPKSVSSKTPSTKSSTWALVSRSVSCATITQTTCITTTYQEKSSIATSLAEGTSTMTVDDTSTSTPAPLVTITSVIVVSAQ